MKRILKLMAAVLAGVFLFAGTACADNGEGGGTVYEVKSVANTVKVMRDDDISAYSDAAVSVQTAKGETEGAQFIVKPQSDVSSYDVAVSDLKKGDKTISADNVTVYVQKYVNVQMGYTQFPSGYYPDALFPIDVVKNYGEDEIAAGNNQGFWLDFKAPADAEAGTYTGTVTLTVNGAVTQIPVSWEVFDFTFPESTDFKTVYLIWKQWLIDGELDNTVDKYRDYYEFMLNYHVVPYTFPVEAGDVDAFIVELRKYYDRVPCYGIPYITVEPYSIDYNLLEDYLAAIVEAGKEDGKNYIDKAYYYFDKIYDEVTEERYPYMRAAIDSTNEREEKVVKQFGLTGEEADAVRNRKHMVPVVRGWQDEFDNYEELIIIPLYNNFITSADIERYEGYIADGHEIHSYGAASYWPYGSNLIDDYMITTRDVFWSKYSYGLKGDLYWNVNAYCNFGVTTGSGYVQLDDLYNTASHDGVTAGDGYLLYPGALYGSESPFPSLRITARRDGIEDYTYFEMLGEEYDRLSQEYGVELDEKNVLDFLNRQIFGTGISKLNFDGLGEVREEVARLIEAAQSGIGLAVESVALEGSTLRLSVLCKSGTKLTADGVEITSAGTAGNGERFIIEKQISADTVTLNASLGESAKSVSLLVGKAEETVNTFDTQDSLGAVTVSEVNGSTKERNESAEFSRGGGSIKAVLSGKVFDTDALTRSFMPYVSVECGSLRNLAEISFWVYNPGEEFTVSVYAENPLVGQQLVLDRCVLAAGGWTKVTVNNFNLISTDADVVANFTVIGLSTENLLDEENNVLTKTLYLDAFAKIAK